MKPTLLTCFAVCLAFLGGLSAQAQSAPIVERIQPTSGPPGTEFQVVGRGLSSVNDLQIAGTSVEVVRRGPTRWTVRVPAGASSGNLSAVWSGPGGATATVRGPYFRVTEAPPAPTITGIAPERGAPGSEVTISGTNFAARSLGNTVSLGGRGVVIRSASPTRLIVVVPDGAETGPFQLSAIGAAAVESEPFEVTEATAISELVPAMGPSGSEIEVRGTGFGARSRDNRLYIGNQPLRVLSVEPGVIRARLPRRFESAPILIDVRGGGRAESEGPFRLQERPVIESIEPPSAPPGARVVVRGSGFGLDPRVLQVRVGDENAEIRGIEEGSFSFEVPERAATAPLSVTVHALEVTSTREFGVLVPVGLFDFRPRSGPVGTVVTLTGQGFSPELSENNVTLSGAQARVVASSGGELRFEIPSGGSGRLVIAVTNNGSTQSNEIFVVTTPPFVASFEPEAGTPGSEVVIRGSQFGTDARLVRVQLGDSAMAISSVQDDQIVATVPRRADTARIEVTVQMQGSGRSGDDFRVIPTAAVESLAPAEGYPGREIALRGYGFPSAGLQVVFPGAGAVDPTAVSPREIRVEVPEGATAGALVVQVDDGRRLTVPTSFSPAETPEGVGIESMRAECLRVGCQVEIRGYGFDQRSRRNRVFLGERRVRVDRSSSTSLLVTLPNLPGAAVLRVVAPDRGEASTEEFTITSRFDVER